MIISHPCISNPIETNIDKVNTIVVENQQLLLSLLTEIISQIKGNDGRLFISNSDKELNVSQYIELIIDYINFDINQKTLITKITSHLEQEALNDENYAITMELLSEINTLLYNLTFCDNYDIDYPKISMGSIIKASGVMIRDDNKTLAERLLEYMELVKRFEKDKLFIFVNLRSFLDDEQTVLFMEDIIRNQFNVLLIDSREYNRLNLENRITIDMDLCEII